MNLFINMWLFIILGRPFDNISVLKPVRIALITTIIIVIYLIIRKREELILKISKSSDTRLFVYFYAIMWIGVLFSLYPRISMQMVVNYYSMVFVLFLVIILHYNNENNLINIMKVFVCVNIFIIIISFINYEYLTERYEYLNSGYDSNDTAYLLLSIMPGSIYFIKTVKNKVYKIGLLSIILTNVFLIFQTGSRGGFIGLVTFMFLVFVKLVKGNRPLHYIAALFIFIIGFIFILQNTDQKRSLSVFSISSDYNYYSDDGRLGIWKHSMRVIIENPVIGVGVACFPEAIGRIREKLNLPPKWQANHNSFLQVASEMGLIALVIFILLVVKTKNNIKKSEHLAHVNTDTNSLPYLSKCISVGFISQIVCSLFLSQAYSIVFALYFAMGEVLSKLSEKSSDYI